MTVLLLGATLLAVGTPVAAAAVQDSDTSPASLKRLEFEYRCYFKTEGWRGRVEGRFLERLRDQQALHRTGGGSDLRALEELFARALWNRIDALWKTEGGKTEALNWADIVLAGLDTRDSDEINTIKQKVEDLTVEYSLDEGDRLLGKDNEKAMSSYAAGLPSRQEAYAIRGMEGMVKAWRLVNGWDAAVASGDILAKCNLLLETFTQLEKRVSPGAPHREAALGVLKPYRTEYEALAETIGPIVVNQPDAAAALAAFKKAGGQSDRLALGEAEIHMTARGNGAEDWPAPGKWRVGIPAKFAVKRGLYDVEVRLPGEGRVVAVYPAVPMGKANTLVVPTEIPRGMVFVGPWTDGSGSHGGFFAMVREVSTGDMKRWVAAVDPEIAELQDGNPTAEQLSEGEELPGWGILPRLVRSIVQNSGLQLPTRQQWIDMAYGPTGGAFPWGEDVPQPGVHGHFADKPQELYPAAMGKYTAGNSPYGLEGMLGGVGEWIDWNGGLWLMGGHFATPLSEVAGGEKSVLRDPKPSEAVYDAMGETDKNRYGEWRVKEEDQQLQFGLRLVLGLR